MRKGKGREERKGEEIWGYGKTVQFGLDHLDGRITVRKRVWR